jgi:hypothetical protein
MPDYELVAVRSNVDRLSVEAVHTLYERAIDRTAEDGADFLRGVVPKREGLMAARVGHHESSATGEDVIEASVGIPRIDEASNIMGSPGAQDSGNYPLFTDRGTGIFGPIHMPIVARSGHMMRWEDGGQVFFRREVKGQVGKHFMLETYEMMHRAILPANVEDMGERIKRLWANPMGIEV